MSSVLRSGLADTHQQPGAVRPALIAVTPINTTTMTHYSMITRAIVVAVVLSSVPTATAGTIIPSLTTGFRF